MERNFRKQMQEYTAVNPRHGKEPRHICLCPVIALSSSLFPHLIYRPITLNHIIRKPPGSGHVIALKFRFIIYKIDHYQSNVKQRPAAY
jgi:hypothetical protein